MITIEVCVNSVESAIVAQKGGADRVELCSNIQEGGVTPSYGLIKSVVQAVDIPVHVLIRPRSGDFLYNELDLDIMKSDIDISGSLGCQGVVFGALLADGSIDVGACYNLISLAKKYNLCSVFHRAFDHTQNPLVSLSDLIDLGFDKVLTSGGYESAFDGIDNIKKIIELASRKIDIIVGSGITPDNILRIIKETNTKEIHGTFSSLVSSRMVYVNPNLLKDIQYKSSDLGIVKKIFSLSC